MRGTVAAAALWSAVAGCAIAAAPEQPLKVTRPEAAKGAARVVIAAFTVGFQVESSESARAGGGLMGGIGGRSSAKSTLEGVSPETMQALTDAAYADFRAQLAARGYTVVDPANFYADPNFARVKPIPTPWSTGVMLGRNSTAKTSFFKPSDIRQLDVLTYDVPFSGFGAMSLGQSAYNFEQAMRGYAKSSGDAVIDVVYLIDFTEAQKHGNMFTTSSSVKVNSALSISPAISKLTLVAPSGGTTVIALRTPVEVEGDFADMADTTGKTAKTMETVANVMGILGGTGTNKSRKYAFTAKAGQYEAGVKQATAQANALIVGQLAGLR